jgi:hypothetical protein
VANYVHQNSFELTGFSVRRQSDLAPVFGGHPYCVASSLVQDSRNLDLNLNVALSLDGRIRCQCPWRCPFAEPAAVQVRIP